MNRTIVERAKSMMFDAELPKRYWVEAVATAVYLINRSPASGIDGRTPEEMWTGQSPNLQHLRVFGCKAMAQIRKERRQKWDSKANELIFVGYEDNVKGYRLMDPRTACVVKRRDVVFWRNFLCSEKVREPEEMRGTIDITFDGEDEHNEDEAKEVSDESDLSNASIDTVRETLESEYATDCGRNGLTSDEDTLIEDEQVPQAADHLTPEGLRRSTRVRKPVNMSDYVTYLAAARDTDEPQTVEDAICGANCEMKKSHGGGEKITGKE
ncbi:retrovirus-related pol polyprotein from transposon tnt 1-94 [Lasius niger]|uniref:Retrovirus-related pol polyprotein from transposon tnt 1-94 n=1 Tax=Lasius niger TaxID=67767 RepID=A0A0J7JWQ3_LASNI|nr:retrovirus-related pol polyprotein from transposon tnt 1-94 [Lasius niger]